MRRHAFRIALTATFALVLALVPTALAGKGGGGKPSGGSTTSTALKVVPLDGATAPYFGGRITFELNTSAEKPYVNVRCYQGTAFVYDSWAAFYSGAWFGTAFTLSSTYWTGGAANCTARLVTYSRNGAERTNATLNFNVGA